MQLKRRVIAAMFVVSITTSAAFAATKVTVKNGDNISTLAQKHHVTRNTIINYNSLKNPDKLKLGQVLTIPTKAEAKKAELKHAKALKTAAAKAQKQAQLAKQKKIAAAKAKKHKLAAAKAAHKKVAAAKKSHKVAAKPAASKSAASVVNTANRFKGTKYVWGGSSRSGFDCSGFTRYVLRNSTGRSLPHSSSAQFSKGVPVSKADLKPGDLVFFSTYKKGPSHVGIYVGNGKFVHASNPGSTVKATSMNSSYYKDRFVGARRISH